MRMICLNQKFNEGILIGKEKGRAEGREEGRKERDIEVARNLLKAGVSVDLIAESTGLPKGEIIQLQEEISRLTVTTLE
ncbi:MAG: hypothetical protein ACR5K9_03020 [Wolbachia sp.]